VKFKLDEHLPVELLGDLRQAGHDASSIFEEGLSGSADQIVMAHVKSEHRCLLTMDKGIADIRAYPPQDYNGIVLFRPHQTGRGAVLRFIRQNLAAVLPLISPGTLIVVSDQGIRAR
jgi:predicted nuclease of predicted toxin-antitoxin system